MGIDFSDDARQSYRDFSSSISRVLAKLEAGVKYFDEIDKIQLRLEELHQRVMLEDYLPDNSALTRCFINGTYYCSKDESIEVACLEKFIRLLRGSTKEKKNIILSNIHSRLDAIDRKIPKLDDEGPF